MGLQRAATRKERIFCPFSLEASWGSWRIEMPSPSYLKSRTEGFRSLSGQANLGTFREFLSHSGEHQPFPALLMSGTARPFEAKPGGEREKKIGRPSLFLPIPTYTLYSILYTLYSILYTLYSILYTLYSILYTLYSILYTLYSILYTLYYILYTIHYILYTIYSILYYTIPYHTIPYQTNLYYTIQSSVTGELADLFGLSGGSWRSSEIKVA